MNLRNQRENLRNHFTRGQAIIEYLVVAMAIIAAVIGVRGLLQAKATNLMTQTINQIP